MRRSAISDLKKLAKHFKINLRSGSAIDVGGTNKVNLDGKITVNPLLKIRPNIIFLDRGFNINTFKTKANEVVDFLNTKSIHHLKNRFTIVFCFDTLEHVSDPIRFCQNLISITKPGGYIYLATVFDWTYHPSPEDYYRFSPSGLRESFTNSSNKLSKQVKIIWSGWGSDPRGVSILLQKVSKSNKNYPEKVLKENWLLKKRKITSKDLGLFTSQLNKIVKLLS
jgi:SAM-dependent methyltransferase